MMFRSYRGFGSCFGFLDRMYGGGWYMPMIMMAVLTVLTVIAVILIVRKINSSSKKNAYDSSLEELKIMYAKGALTEEEYLRKKKILSE